MHGARMIKPRVLLPLFDVGFSHATPRELTPATMNRHGHMLSKACFARTKKSHACDPLAKLTRTLHFILLIHANHKGHAASCSAPKDQHYSHLRTEKKA